MGQTVEVISEVPVSTEEVALKNKIRSTAGTPGRPKYPIVTLERLQDDQGNRSLTPVQRERLASTCGQTTSMPWSKRLDDTRATLNENTTCSTPRSETLST